MIRVVVDLVPYGNENGTTKIGELILANTGNLGFGKAKYDAVMSIISGGKVRDIERKANIEHFRQEGFYELIKKIVDAPKCEEDLLIFEELEKKLNIGE